MPPRAADGPREIRALSDALTAMHDLLAGHAASRTPMLAAIAQDLGTYPFVLSLSKHCTFFVAQD